MTKFDVLQKCGFVANCAKVLILDENKKEFYNYSPKNRMFNLPKGSYFLDNSVKIKETKPLVFKLPYLPKPQKRTKLEPKDFIIKMVQNPNKASIFLHEGRIEIDSNFWANLSRVQKEYVLNHELGHLYFEDEKRADLYAMEQMLKIGYNPSQIANVVLKTFSVNKENLARCENVINNLI